MSYKVVTTPAFERRFKPLAKKHRSILNDLNELIESLKEKPTQGVLIRESCYKIRMAIASKGRGKSGGARVFTFVRVVNETVFLIEIFDKSDKANISEKELDEALDFVQYSDINTSSEEE